MPSYHVTQADRDLAVDITKRIKTSADNLWELLLQAWNMKAYVSLGYKTWGAYVDAEFDFKRRYSYRLVNQGQVIKQLREAASHGTQDGAVRVSEREARDIATFGTDGVGAVVHPSVIEHVQEQVSAGVAPQDAVQIAVERVRAEPITRSRFDDGYDIPEEPTSCAHEYVCRHCGELA